MNTYSTTMSLPSFPSRYMEVCYDAQYLGKHNVALAAAQHSGRCESMYCGSEYDLDTTPIFGFTYKAAVYERFHDYQDYTVHRFLIHGAWYNIVCPFLKDAYRIANCIARMSDDQVQLVMDDNRCGFITRPARFFIFGTTFLSQISTFLQP